MTTEKGKVKRTNNYWVFYIYYHGNTYNLKEVLLQMRKWALGEETTQGLG